MFPSDLHLLALGDDELGRSCLLQTTGHEWRILHRNKVGSNHAHARASYWDCRKKKVAQNLLKLGW